MRGAGTQTVRSLPALLRGLTLLWLLGAGTMATRVPTPDTNANLYLAMSHIEGIIQIKNLPCRR
jgi:hypothetical protein